MGSSSLVAKNTAYQFLSKFVTLAFGLVARKLLTTYLGPAGFGDYGLVLTYVGLFSSLADWGTQLIGIRTASQNSSLSGQIFGSLMVLRTGMAILAFLLALAILPWLGLSVSLLSVFKLASFLILIFAVKASFGVVFDTFLRTDRWLFVELTSSLASLALVFLGTTLGLNLSWFFLALIVSSTLATLVAFLLSRRISSTSWTFSIGSLKHLALESLPLGGVLMVYGLYNRVDTLILKVFSSSQSVGFYILAYLIYENLSYFASYFTVSALPLLASLKSKPEISQTFQKIYDLLIVGGLLAGLGSFLAASHLVRLLSSVQFAPAASLLQILSFALLFAFLNHGTGYTLIALGLQRPYLGISALALLFNISLNLWLIPYFGALGAATVTIFTEVLVQLLSLFLLAKALKQFPKFYSFPKTVVQFVRARGQIF